MNHDIFAREPLSFRGTIPVYSKPNEYTDNYDSISHDHLKSLMSDGTNPFIPEDLWVQSEESTARLIEKYSKTGDVILDVGVGLGRLLTRFPRLQRYGIDISFGYLEAAQREGINVCYALVEDMPYSESSFDIVVCTDVLEHVLDLNLCCSKILQVLKPGGTLIVRVPDREDLAGYLDPSCPYKYVHLRNFDGNSLRLLFEKIFGCDCVEILPVTFCLSSHFRYQIPIPKRDGIVSRLLSITKSIRPPVYEALLHKLFRPVEINVVIKKPHSQSGEIGGEPVQVDDLRKSPMIDQGPSTLASSDSETGKRSGAVGVRANLEQDRTSHGLLKSL